MGAAIVNGLTARETEIELNYQIHRRGRKYDRIARCCSAVIGIATAVATVVFYFFISCVPGGIFNNLSFLVLSPIQKAVCLASFSLIFSGIGIGAGFGAFWAAKVEIVDKISGFFLNRYRQKRLGVLSGLDANVRLDHTRLVKVIKLTDDTSLKMLISHMDFEQLCTTKKILGEKKFVKLTGGHQSNYWENSELFKLLEKIDSLKSLAYGSRNSKIQELENEFLHYYRDRRFFSLFQMTVLQQLRKESLADSLVYWVRKWSGVDDPVEKIAHAESLDEEVAVDSQLKITVQNQDRSIQLDAVPKALLQRESPLINHLWQDPNWEQNPQILDGDPHKFKQVFNLFINRRANGSLTSEAICLGWRRNEQLGRIFVYTYKYWDRVAATLQLALTDKEFNHFVTDRQARTEYWKKRIPV